MNITLSILSLVFFAVLSTSPVYGENSPLVINELSPSPVAGPEWIELYNPGPDPLDLAGWSLEDLLTTPSVITVFTTQLLNPGSFVLYELPVSKLNNSGDGVILKNASGAIIDSMSYSSSLPDKTWARSPSFTGQFISSEPSKGQPNPLPSPSPSPSPTPTPLPQNNAAAFQVSEVMACPSTGESEWIELYNPTSNQIQLTNGSLTDISDNSKPFSLALAAHSFGIISWSGSLLNNTGDGFYLRDQAGNTLFSAILSACVVGRSFVNVDDLWQETLSPSKSGQNVFVSVQPSPTPSPPADRTPSFEAAALATLENDFSALIPDGLPSLNLGTEATQSALPTRSVGQKKLINFSPLSLELLPDASPTPQEVSTILGSRTSFLQSPDLPQQTYSTAASAKMGATSVIIGGLVMSLSSGYRLYETVSNSVKYLD